MTIGEQLRKLRKGQGLTAKQLSERSGVPEKTIYRIETEEVADPKISSIKPLIMALNCSADEILMNKQDIGLTGLLKQHFERANKLPIKEKTLLIKIISRWISSVNVEEMYKETLSHNDRNIRKEMEENEEHEFNEIVKKELESEHYSNLADNQN